MARTLPSTPEQALPARLALGLSKLGTALRAQAWSEGGEASLTPTQGQILATLLARGPLRVSGLAAQLGVSVPTASDSVAALEAKGLLLRKPDPEDRRAVSLSLTTKGRTRAKAVSAWPDFLAAAVGGLDPEEQAVLVRSLLKLIRSLQEEGRIAPARLCATCAFFRPHAHPDSKKPHHCAFVDAPFGDAELRLDCPDHEELGAEAASDVWGRFLKAPHS